MPISSCWVVTEGLVGLRNQAVGLAQALGIPYIVKEFKTPKGLLQKLLPGKPDLSPPWPDLLITCGRRGVAVSMAVRRASQKKTFTVHIQDPLGDPGRFDAVIVPAHDKVRGENVFVTMGATHHVSREKLAGAAGHFRPLLSSLPRPLITVLIGGKNRHQEFTQGLARDFALKLRSAAVSTGGGLAVSFSRRTGARAEAVIKQGLAGVPSYIWDSQGENPYFGFLSLADVIVVTSDSVSMLSEACSTGKPVYMYDMPNAGGRHKQFCESLVQAGFARPFSGAVEAWKNTPLDETRKAAEFVYERFMKERDKKYANADSGNNP